MINGIWSHKLALRHYLSGKHRNVVATKMTHISNQMLVKSNFNWQRYLVSLNAGDLSFLSKYDAYYHWLLYKLPFIHLFKGSPKHKQLLINQSTRQANAFLNRLSRNHRSTIDSDAISTIEGREKDAEETSVGETNNASGSPVVSDSTCSIRSAESPHFTFIVTAYNTEQWLMKCVGSIFNQKAEAHTFHIIFVNDASTDNTSKMCEELERTYGDRFVHILNSARMYPAYSRKIAYERCDETDICIFIDGDDWLCSDDLLTALKTMYERTGCLMTFGSFVYDEDTCKTNPTSNTDWQYKQRSYCYDRHLIGSANGFFPHLRTVQAGVCKSVPDAYLKDHEGQYAQVCTDCALFQSCVELAGFDAVGLMDDKVYVYNRYNTLHADTGYHNAKTNSDNVYNAYRKNILEHLSQLQPLGHLHESIVDGLRLHNLPLLEVSAIPPIFWINLDGATERRAQFLEGVRTSGIPLECCTRISGVDGRSSEQVKQLMASATLKPNEIGCNLSHKLALETYVHSDAKKPWALICEDDASFELRPYWSCGGDMNLILNQAPDECDCLLLHVTTHGHSISILTKAGNDYIPKTNNAERYAHGTMCYAIRYGAAQRIVSEWDMAKASNFPADHYFYNMVNTYIYKYPCIIQLHNTFSQIQTRKGHDTLHVYCRERVRVWSKLNWNINERSSEWSTSLNLPCG
jgi:glycosyltransferase involved in cell wall biosynthesis/GR25 family glycosyltransferase involved in LPS biosynthesis